MKTFAYLLTLVLSTVLFFSCTSESVNEEVVQNETYIFQNIEYYYNNDDYTQVKEIPQENVLLINNTDKSFSWVTQPYIAATDYSVFKGANEYATRLNVDKKLEVPVPVINNTSRGLLNPTDDRKFRLFEEVSTPAEYYDKQEKYFVAPYSEIVMKGTECIEEFSITYEAVFKGVNTGEIVVVKGKWQGSINLGWKNQEVLTHSIKS